MSRAKVTYELEGWGTSHKNPARRGGFWSRYTFDTLKEAKAEARRQYRDQAWGDQAWGLRQRALCEKEYGPDRAIARWGDDHDRDFPVYKVTREVVR